MTSSTTIIGGGRCVGMETVVEELEGRLGGVVVITSALHAEGPRFEPGSSQAAVGE